MNPETITLAIDVVDPSLGSAWSSPTAISLLHTWIPKEQFTDSPYLMNITGTGILIIKWLLNETVTGLRILFSFPLLYRSFSPSL